MARIRSRIRSWFLLALLCVLLVPELVVPAKKKKRDHYDVLAVPRDASDRQIKKAFHKLARKFHPDKNKSANAEAKFREIAEAYETLSDDKRRREYDQFGHAAPPTPPPPGNTGGGWGGGGGGGGGGDDYDFQQHFRSFNFDDWFKEFEVFGPQQQQQQDIRSHQKNRVQGANKNKHKQKSQRSSSSSQGGAFGGFFEDFEQLFSLGGGAARGPGASGRQQQQQCRTVTQRRGNMVTTYTVCS